VSTSCQRLRRPQLVSARDVLQQMRGCAHLMRLPVHLLRLNAAHINLPTAELQQHSMPHKAKQPPLCAVRNFIHTPDPNGSPSFADKCVFESWSLDSYHYKKAAASSTVDLPLSDQPILYAEEMWHDQRTCDTHVCMHKMVAGHTCGDGLAALFWCRS